MGSISDFWENEMLDHVLGVGAYTAPTIYVGLSTADPLDDASGIAEPSGNNYARVAHASWDAAAARKTSNTGTVTFNTASGPWGTITHWFLCDHASNTTWGTNVNLLAHGSLAASKSVVSGNTPSFADDELDVSFSASGSGGGWCDLLCNEMLDHVFGVGSYTAPTLYVGLSTGTPLDDGTGAVEPSGNGYARQAVGACSASSGGTSDNDAQILFDTPSGSWGTITHAVVTNHISNAFGNTVNLMWVDVTDQAVGSGDTVDFAAGALDFSLS